MTKRLKKQAHNAALQNMVQHLLVDENKGGGAMSRKNTNALKNLTTNNGKYQIVMKPGAREQTKKYIEGIKSRQNNEAAAEQYRKDAKEVGDFANEVYEWLRLDPNEIRDPIARDPMATFRGAFNIVNSRNELKERRDIIEIVREKHTEKAKHLEETDQKKDPFFWQKVCLLHEIEYYDIALGFRNIFFHRSQTEELLKEVQRVEKLISEQKEDKKKFKSLSARIFDSDQELHHIRRSLRYGELCDCMEHYYRNRLKQLKAHRQELFELLDDGNDEDGLILTQSECPIENKRLEIRRVDIVVERCEEILKDKRLDKKKVKLDDFSKLQKTAQMWWAIMKMELKRLCETEMNELNGKIKTVEKEIQSAKWRISLVEKQERLAMEEQEKQSKKNLLSVRVDLNQSTWESWRQPWEVLLRKADGRLQELKDRVQELEEIIQEDYEEVVNGPSTSKEVLNSIRQYVTNPQGKASLITSLLKNMFK